MTCTASRHGGEGITWLTSYTKYGCRCPDARRAASRHQKALRLSQLRGEERIVSASGTLLRLRALQAIGYPVELLAELLGYKGKGALGHLLYATRPSITTRRHRKVVELYDRLWNTPGPSDRARRFAARRGWPLPLDLDDDLLDDPTYRPVNNRLDEVTARRQERELLSARVAELERKGRSAREIGLELGVSARLVQRRRALARAEAA